MISKHQAGFTMVDVLISLSVTTVMIMILTNYMLSNLQTSTLEASRAAIQREIQLTLDAVAADIRLSANADLNNRNPDVNSPGGAGNQYGWASSASTLVLATAATTSSKAIIFSDPANYVTTKNNIVYFVSGGKLYKRLLAAPVSDNGDKTSCPASMATVTCPPDKEMLNNVSAFSITYLDGSSNSVTPTNARSIQISVTAARTQYKQTQSASYTTRMVFRND